MASYQSPAGSPDATPSSVANAVKLMYVGAGLSLLWFIVSLTQIGNVREAARQSAQESGVPSEQLDTVVNTAATVGTLMAVLFGLVPIALWIWMAIMNQRGRNWARILSTVFFGLATIGLLATIVNIGSVLAFIFQILVWLVGLGAVVLIWRPTSAPHYASRIPQGPPIPPEGYSPPPPAS